MCGSRCPPAAPVERVARGYLAPRGYLALFLLRDIRGGPCTRISRNSKSCCIELQYNTDQKYRPRYQ